MREVGASFRLATALALLPLVDRSPVSQSPISPLSCCRVITFGAKADILGGYITFNSSCWLQYMYIFYDIYIYTSCCAGIRSEEKLNVIVLETKVSSNTLNTCVHNSVTMTSLISGILLMSEWLKVFVLQCSDSIFSPKFLISSWHWNISVVGIADFI